MSDEEPWPKPRATIRIAWAVYVLAVLVVIVMLLNP